MNDEEITTTQKAHREIHGRLSALEFLLGHLLQKSFHSQAPNTQDLDSHQTAEAIARQVQSLRAAFLMPPSVVGDERPSQIRDSEEKCFDRIVGIATGNSPIYS